MKKNTPRTAVVAGISRETERIIEKVGLIEGTGDI